MNIKPLLYDVFCGAGGATRGYQMAGFRVIGVDNRPQPHYIGDGFIQMDAFEFFRRYVAGKYEEAAVFHCSPPCQRFSAASRCRPGLTEQYPDFIIPIRERLRVAGVPYVIENVPGAPLENPTLLCGQMFGLDLFRHRIFETNIELPFLLHTHSKPGSKVGGGGAKRGGWVPGKIISIAGNCAPIAEARRVMEIDWMTRDELAEAIPPAYCEFIGRHLMEYLLSVREGVLAR